MFIHRSGVFPFNKHKPIPKRETTPVEESQDPLYGHSNNSAIRLTRAVNLGKIATPPRDFSRSLEEYNKNQAKESRKTMFLQEALKMYTYWTTRNKA